MYVDDIIISSASITSIDKLKDHLNVVLKLKDIGALWYFLGFEIACSSKGIVFS